MRKLTIIIISLFLSVVVHAQLIDNKLNVYIGASLGNSLGTETVNSDNYISPSLYSNYKVLAGVSVKGVVKAKDFLGYGLSYNYQRADGWESLNYSDFDNSTVNLHSITPLIKFHNRFTDKGLSNRFVFFIECGPTVGLANLALAEPLFDIPIYENKLLVDDKSLVPMYDFSLFMGFKSEVGIEYAYRHGIGLFLSYSYSSDWISSKLYNDNVLKRSMIDRKSVV